MLLQKLHENANKLQNAFPCQVRPVAPLGESIPALSLWIKHNVESSQTSSFPSTHWSVNLYCLIARNPERRIWILVLGGFQSMLVPSSAHSFSRDFSFPRNSSQPAVALSVENEIVMFSDLPSFTLPPIASGASPPHFLISNTSLNADSSWKAALTRLSWESNAWFQWLANYTPKKWKRHDLQNFC